METIITLVVFIAGFLTGLLVTRNNIKKINSIVDDAEDFASQVNQKLDELRDQGITKKVKQPVKQPAKRGRPATKK
tara:strand:+ start:2189 stop:2416 length:228 start_codon:yes stop_codon:yes gene_type:complete